MSTVPYHNFLSTRINTLQRKILQPPYQTQGGNWQSRASSWLRIYKNTMDPEGHVVLHTGIFVPIFSHYLVPEKTLC